MALQRFALTICAVLVVSLSFPVPHSTSQAAVISLEGSSHSDGGGAVDQNGFRWTTSALMTNGLPIIGYDSRDNSVGGDGGLHPRVARYLSQSAIAAPVRLDDPAVTYDNATAVDLAANSSGLILAMFLDGDPPSGANQGHFVVRRSMDLGATWSTAVIPSPLAGVTAGWGSGLVSAHQLYFDVLSGQFYFFWATNPTSYITTSDGVTWSAVTTTSVSSSSADPSRSRILQFARTSSGTWIAYGNMFDGGSGWAEAEMAVWRLDNGLTTAPSTQAVHLFAARDVDGTPITQTQRSVEHTPGAAFYLPASQTPNRLYLIFGATAFTGTFSNAHGHLFDWYSDDDGASWQNENGPLLDPFNSDGTQSSLAGAADAETPDPEPPLGPLADVSGLWVPNFGQMVVWGVEGNNNNNAPGLDVSVFQNGSHDQARVQGVGGYPTSAGDFGQSLPSTYGNPTEDAFSPDPINLATGSFTNHADDLIMPGRVLSFAFTRWYNSADDSTGALGPGWTHSYNWSLTDHTATVDIRRGDGRRDTFTRNPDGTYADPPNVFDTLTKNADATFTLTLTNQVSYEFSSAGRLARIHEPASNQITLAYTGSNLTTITETVGRQVSLSYDGSNRLTQLQDPLGRKVTYAYDTNGRLATVTDKIGNATGQNPALHQWRYAYDGTTRHITTITDPDARVRVTNSYDGQGRVYLQLDGLNAPTQIVYGAGQATLTDARGHSSTYTFDSRMRVLSQTDVVGANAYAFSYVYDASGNRTSVTDRNGKTTAFTYDTHGNVLTKTDPQVGTSPRYVTNFQYDSKNNLRLITDARGMTTTMTYDPTTNVPLSASRQIDATTYPVTKYEYGDAANPGLPTRVIAPRGNIGPTPNYAYSTSLTYDSQGNLVTQIDADNTKTTFVYDGAGRLLSSVDPDGNATGGTPSQHTWSATLDENDRLTSATDPLGNALHYSYNGSGDRLTNADRDGNTTTYTYDANARLATVVQKPNPVGQPTLTYTTSLTRDGNGNATRVTQANSVVTDYSFDALNRLTSTTTHPDASTTLTTTYVLDGNGNPRTRTTGDGVIVTYAYDEMSRLTSVSATGLATITYGYDELSRRIQLVDGSGTTTYQYDGLGRATQVAAPSGTLTYAYDLDGNRTTIGYPGSQNVTYAYTPGGRLNTVTDWASRLSTYTYQPSGLVSSLAYPNGMRAAYTYDRAQRLTQLTNSVASTTITQDTYTLDAEGNRTALDEYIQGITPPVLTWSASVQVNDNANGQQDRPAIAIGADGATYLIWDDYRAGSNGDIYFSRRDPSTGVWSANQKVNNDTGTATQWEPAIALDGSNNAYAIWSDQRDSTRTKNDINIYFSKRTASTGAWSANVRVNNDTTGTAIQGAPAIAVKSTGDAVSVWEDHRSSQNNIYSSRLPAGSSTWAANIRVTDNTVSNKYTPDLAMGSDGTAYAVWEDDRSGNSDIWFSTLPWGSSTWAANVKISDDPGTSAQYDPHIGIDTAGDLIVIWQDNRVASGQVRMRRRAAGSQNWDASIVASDAAAIPVAIALGVSNDGNAFAVWQDARGTSYDVWGSDYTYASNTWSTPSLVSDDPGATAQMRPTVARSTGEIETAWRDDRVTGGDIRARRRSASNGTDHFTYTYDGLDRLTAVGGPVPESFSFDAASNITSRTGPSATNTYDTANRQTSDGARTFVWDGADRLVTRGTDTFVYDPLSRLISTSVGGTTRAFTYNGDGLLASRPGGALLWDSSVAPAPLIQSATDKIVYGLGPIYVAHADGTTATFARDGLGSVRAEVGDSGVLAKPFRYNAYGQLTAAPSGGPSLLGFAGELLDPSGLTYLRARWYDPATARFVSGDPVAGHPLTPSTLNRYSYVDGSPTMHTDSSGLCTGGGDILYCIERWIPTAIACPPEGPICGTGNDRYAPDAFGGGYKVQMLVHESGVVTTNVGWTQPTNRDGVPLFFPLPGTLVGCGGSYASGNGWSATSVSCTAGNAFAGAPGSPPSIKMRVQILDIAGRVMVWAAGTMYPSLAVYGYGSQGAQLLYFYDAAAVGLEGLGTVGTLPNTGKG